MRRQRYTVAERSGSAVTDVLACVGTRITRAAIGLVACIALAGMLFGAATALGQPNGAAPGDDQQAFAGAAAGDLQPAPLATEDPIPTKSLWGIIHSGGLLMIPLAACSMVLFAFIFERSISLRRGRVIPRPFVRRFLAQMHSGELDRQQAMTLCEESGSPVADVFAGAVRKWGRPAVEVEQAIIDAGERVTNSLRRYLRVLNTVATISPLLGLLGTVVGMIRAFNAIATSDAMGRPELLAAGISQALLTTAAGLSVAIPALIFYLFFVSRVDRLIMDIDSLGQELVPLISAEEMGNRPKPSAETKAAKKANRSAA